MRKIIYTSILSVLLFISCKKGDDIESSTLFKEYKVAVVLPASNNERWELIVDWQDELMSNAFAGVVGEGVKLSIEWVDEEMDGLSAELDRLADDETIEAIIGPYYSSNAMLAAQSCSFSQKCLVLPTASSTELHRLYSGRNFMWVLAESDIAQCEILLMSAKTKGATDVSLVCRDDIYGASFSDWFGFQAAEMGLAISTICEYSSEEELTAGLQEISALYESGMDAPMIIFAPSYVSDALAFDVAKTNIEASGGFVPNVLCSDVAYSTDVSSTVVGSYEGITLSADPESGFYDKYREYFGSVPLAGEANLYDALSLVTLGLYVKSLDDISLNSAITELVTGTDGSLTWSEMNSQTVFAALKSGSRPILNGAVGPWQFDGDGLTSLLYSTYLFWSLTDNWVDLVDFTTTDPTNRESVTSASWEWVINEYQEFDESALSYSYPDSEERWALVIAASEGWSNYRHQADAHSTYKMLKRNGYTDENIILIVADDIAYNEKNLYPGVLKVSQDGDNVYSESDIDYYLGDLRPSDIYNILNGVVTDTTPEVIESSSNDNVFLFWSGHGSYNCLGWGDAGYGMTSSSFNTAINDMTANQKFRKLFIAIEACYSGSIASYCANSNNKGVLFITAANPYETSKADVRDTEMNIWLSNSFTRRFEELIDSYTDISIRELYYELAIATSTSHVSVYNYSNYGNMYLETMSDFLE